MILGPTARFRPTRRALLAGAAATLLAGPAFAQLRVDVTGGRIEALPIAVSPFAGDGPGASGLGREIRDVVAADLARSGLFEVIEEGAYIQSPDGLRQTPRYADWRQINAQALVAGVVALDAGGGLGVDFRLFDVFAGQQLQGLRYTSSTDNWRQIAHRIADVVYERITGDKGYFDSRIVYVAETGPATARTKRLALMDQDGSNHRFLTDGGDLVLTPQFSPDGREIAYLAYGAPQPKVYLKTLSGGRDALVGDLPGMTFSPRFSPDGGTMLVTQAQNGNADIVSLDRASGRWTRLTSDPAIDTSPSFSPDGDRIVLNSDRGGSPQLYVMGRTGGDPRRISFGEGRYGSPAWSPGGDLIAFTKVKGGFFHIGVMRPDGSDERLITRSFLDENPSWAPNGRTIVFAREDPVRSRRRLFTIDVTGYNERELATPTDASDPDWSPLIP
ncbi:MAG: Tol-Pal system protein TolB [Geminicoccaceae bacterium]|nr:Tol-Pal system protein TolB [Geminicoccaceae bacterium]